MSYSDPAMAGSRFERREKDRYWTHDWVTAALCETWPHVPARIWEPAAGRGDMVRVLRDFGCEVFASDIDLGEYMEDGGGEVLDFLTETPSEPDRFDAIVTNPPYDCAERFVRRAIEYMGWTDIRMVAMLLRSEFKHAKRRQDLFGGCEQYAGEVVLTTRPRWDWWYTKTSESSPRHNFSWFVWQKLPGVALQRFHYRRQRK